MKIKAIYTLLPATYKWVYTQRGLYVNWIPLTRNDGNDVCAQQYHKQK